MADDSKNESFVFDEDGSAIKGMKSMTMEIASKARTLMAPMETGQQSLDCKVIDPKEVTVTGYVSIDDTDTLTKLESMHASRRFKFYRVMSGGIVHPNLVLLQFRKARETNMIDMYRVTLVYQEAMMIQSSKRNTRSPDFSATASTGRVS